MRKFVFKILALLIPFPLVACAITVEKKQCPSSWVLYQKDSYNFSFCYPHNSHVTVQTDRNFEGSRIQNYGLDEERSELHSTEYYLELFVYDHKKGYKYSRMENSVIYTSCADEILDPIALPLGNIIGLKGKEKDNYESGGTSFVLCVQKPGMDIYLRVTEGNPDGIIANEILDSFSMQ